MHVAIVTETLCTGGAETFVLRLAAELLSAGHRPNVVVLRGDRIEMGLASAIAPDVPVIPIRLYGLTALLRIDGFFYITGLRFSLVRWFQAYALTRILRRVDAELAHSHLLNCDLVTATAARAAKIPWISTMHGDYLAFEGEGRDRAARIGDFGAAVGEIEDAVSTLVCISETQETQMRRLMPRLAARDGIIRIPNGYPPHLEPLFDVPEALRTTPDETLVIGMVSRGVKQKGWNVLIRAFLEFDHPSTRLILVGDGQYLQQLQSKTTDPRIIFVGGVTDPLSYVRRFDVACLPTMFESGSLPTVVIEYLCLGKPVIAARVGEIPTMLCVDSAAPAGIVIRQGGEDEMVVEMLGAMRVLASDPSLRLKMSMSAKRAFVPYRMDKCVASYVSLYRKALGT